VEWRRGARGVSGPPRQRGKAHGCPGWVRGGGQDRGRGLFLVPGESPIGFRLPLSALPRLRPVDYPYLVPADPMDARGELPDPGLLAQAIGSRNEDAAARAKLLDVPRGQGAPAPAVAPAPGSGAPGRPALTVR